MTSMRSSARRPAGMGRIVFPDHRQKYRESNFQPQVLGSFKHVCKGLLEVRAGS